MANMNMIQSLNDALDIMLERDDDVIVYGEVTDGDQVRDGDSSVHLRKNGLSY